MKMLIFEIVVRSLIFCCGCKDCEAIKNRLEKGFEEGKEFLYHTNVYEIIKKKLFVFNIHL